MTSLEVESTLYSWIDRFRTLFSADTWQRVAMDLSKNEFLALLFLQRAEQARMSELAAYLDVPLNTATGVVARLKARGLVERRPSPDDRRLVIVTLSAEGREQVGHAFRDALALAGRVLDGLSAEQLQVLLATLERVLELVLEPEREPARPPVRRRIPIE